jgi:hypothetical protein
MNNLFNQSKPASEYPKDWYVIPTMEVIELFNNLKSEWRKKVMKMEILSGQVAVFELESLIDKISQQKITRKNANTMSDGAGKDNALLEIGCNKDNALSADTQSQQIVTEESNNSTSFDNSVEGVSHSNTMGTHANRPADTQTKAIILDDNPFSIACYLQEHPEIDFTVSDSKIDSKNTVGCGKEITYKYHTEDNYSETKIGVLGKCGALKGFPNKDWKERILCEECKLKGEGKDES